MGFRSQNVNTTARSIGGSIMKMFSIVHWRHPLCLIAAIAFITGLSITSWVIADQESASTERSKKSMQVYFLEIVTKDVNAVCRTYEATHGVKFGQPDAALGNARTAAMPNGGMVSVRAPLRETEEPIVRPYWLVEDIKAAVTAAEKSGGTIAHPAMEIPGHGTFAIYLLGGNDHGLWQKPK